MNIKQNLILLVCLFLSLLSCSDFFEKNKDRDQKSLTDRLKDQAQEHVEEALEDLTDEFNQELTQTPSRSPSRFTKLEDNGFLSPHKKDLKWYLKTLRILIEASERGNTEAMYYLGLLYKEGLHKDLKEALYWLEKAAKRDHLEAQYTLGEMYYEKEDFNLAFFWFQKASTQGLIKAKKMLERIIEEENSSL